MLSTRQNAGINLRHTIISMPMPKHFKQRRKMMLAENFAAYERRGTRAQFIYLYTFVSLGGVFSRYSALQPVSATASGIMRLCFLKRDIYAALPGRRKCAYTSRMLPTAEEEEILLLSASRFRYAMPMLNILSPPPPCAVHRCGGACYFGEARADESDEPAIYLPYSTRARRFRTIERRDYARASPAASFFIYSSLTPHLP